MQNKFKKGDRVIQDINGEWIAATVSKYDDEDNHLFCIWDDDNKIAGTMEEGLILLSVYNSPLYKALT